MGDKQTLSDQSSRVQWLNAPLIVHKCKGCGLLFDSPSICMSDGRMTEPIVRPIKLVLWRDRLGPRGVGAAGSSDVPITQEDADAVICVNFETGEATVYPIIRDTELGNSRTGPARTEGLELVVIAEREIVKLRPRRNLPDTGTIGPPPDRRSLGERIRSAFNG